MKTFSSPVKKNITRIIITHKKTPARFNEQEKRKKIKKRDNMKNEKKTT